MMSVSSRLTFLQPSAFLILLRSIGKETGRPVVVFLGLGCVRYLTALYDEMAIALNLRLICVDRCVNLLDALVRTTDY